MFYKENINFQRNIMYECILQSLDVVNKYRYAKNGNKFTVSHVCLIHMQAIKFFKLTIQFKFKIHIFSAYDVFAICEYFGVLLNFAYHGCAFFDIRYKVIFSVRLVEPLKKNGEQNPT